MQTNQHFPMSPSQQLQFLISRSYSCPFPTVAHFPQLPISHCYNCPFPTVTVANFPQLQLPISPQLQLPISHSYSCPFPTIAHFPQLQLPISLSFSWPFPTVAYFPTVTVAHFSQLPISHSCPFPTVAYFHTAVRKVHRAMVFCAYGCKDGTSDCLRMISMRWHSTSVCVFIYI